MLSFRKIRDRSTLKKNYINKEFFELNTSKLRLAKRSAVIVNFIMYKLHH